MLDIDAQQLVECPYFTLDLLASTTETLALDTAGASFHAFTVIEGQAAVECGNRNSPLSRYETSDCTADSGLYAVRPLAPCRALLSRVP